MTRLRGAHAVITGGSSGIGLATACLLAQRGARISLIARDRSRLEAAVALVRATGSDAEVRSEPADVTDQPGLRRAIAALSEANGPCDVLVCAAGEAYPGYFTALDDAVFRDQMEVHYFGTLHAVRAVVPSMVARRHGHVVTVASTGALIGVYGYSAYAPAKYAVRGLAETLDAELRSAGVVVSCVYPPDTVTDGWRRENERKPPETAAVSSQIKPRDAEHVAAAIVKGIERNRRMISADFQTAALGRTGRLGAWIGGRAMARRLRRATVRADRDA